MNDKADKNTDGNTEDKHTPKKPEGHETEGAYERLLKRAKKVPHPGTVRVSLFTNPK